MSENENETKAVALYHGPATDAPATLARLQSSRAVMLTASRVVRLSIGHKVVPNLDEALLISQAALSQGLDVFTELHWWINTYTKDGVEIRDLTIMRSRDGKVRLANEAARRTGTNLSRPRYYQITKNQKKELEIPLDALALEARIEDDRSVKDWIEKAERISKLGFSKDEIEDKIGECPFWSGIGVVTQDEIRQAETWYHKCKNDETNTYKPKGKNYKLRQLVGYGNCPDCGEATRLKPPKWTWTERARKRAYTQAITPWTAQVDADKLAEVVKMDDMVIDGEWMDITVEEPTEELAKKAAVAADTLYPVDDEDEDPKKHRRKPSFWRKEVLEAIVKADYADNEFEAAGMLSHSSFHPTVGLEPALFYSKHYRANRDEGLDSAKAGVKAFKKYTEEFAKGNG